MDHREPLFDEELEDQLWALCQYDPNYLVHWPFQCKLEAMETAEEMELEEEEVYEARPMRAVADIAVIDLCDDNYDASSPLEQGVMASAVAFAPRDSHSDSILLRFSKSVAAAVREGSAAAAMEGVSETEGGASAAEGASAIEGVAIAAAMEGGAVAAAMLEGGAVAATGDATACVLPSIAVLRRPPRPSSHGGLVHAALARSDTGWCPEWRSAS